MLHQKIGLVATCALAILSGCAGNAEQPSSSSPAPQPSAATAARTFTYAKYEFDLSAKPVLGETSANHTIVLAFDYSCSWCKKWMTDVLPELRERYISKNTVRFVSQPLVLLNNNSLTMAEADYLVEVHAPERYYETQLSFVSDISPDRKNWGTPDYVSGKLKELGMDYKEWKESTAVPDRLTLTRDYTKKKDVEGVPTLYVDGIKIYDAFNLKEIEAVLNGGIREGQTLPIHS